MYTYTDIFLMFMGVWFLVNSAAFVGLTIYWVKEGVIDPKEFTELSAWGRLHTFTVAGIVQIPLFVIMMVKIWERRG